MMKKLILFALFALFFTGKVHAINKGYLEKSSASVTYANGSLPFAYTTDDSSYPFTFALSSGAGWNGLVFPGPPINWIDNSTVTLVQAETMPAGSTVTFQLQERPYHGVNISSSNIISLTTSTANDLGVDITSFRDAVIAPYSTIVLTTPASGASQGNPTNLRVTVWYKRQRR